MEAQLSKKPKAKERAKKKNLKKHVNDVPLIDEQIPKPFSLNEIEEIAFEEATTSEKSNDKEEILEEVINPIPQKIEISRAIDTMQKDFTSPNISKLENVNIFTDKSKVFFNLKQVPFKNNCSLRISLARIDLFISRK